MAIFLLIAISLGIITSLPFSALGAYMINQTLQKGFWQGFYIASISASFDVFYCFVSLLGMSLVIGSPCLRFGIQGAGLLFLIYIGYKIFFVKKEPKNPQKNITYFKNGMFVFSYYLSNPIIFAFWLNLASVLHGTLLMRSPIWKQVFFSICVGLGSLIINCLSLQLVIYGKTNLLSLRIIQKITAIIYVLSIVIFAYYLISSIL